MAAMVTIATGAVLVLAGLVVRWLDVPLPSSRRSTTSAEQRAALRRWVGGSMVVLGLLSAGAGMAVLAGAGHLGGVLWALFLGGVVVGSVGARHRCQAPGAGSHGGRGASIRGSDEATGPNRSERLLQSR